MKCHNCGHFSQPTEVESEVYQLKWIRERLEELTDTFADSDGLHALYKLLDFVDRAVRATPGADQLLKYALAEIARRVRCWSPPEEAKIKASSRVVRQLMNELADAIESGKL